MTIYNRNEIVDINGSIILIRMIESFSAYESDVSEDNVIAKLQDDYVFSVTTASGKQHVISTNNLHKELVRADDSAKELLGSDLAKAILDKWLRSV